eukprot:6065011-Prymnesium_polylepis.1
MPPHDHATDAGHSAVLTSEHLNHVPAPHGRARTSGLACLHLVSAYPTQFRTITARLGLGAVLVSPT